VTADAVGGLTLEQYVEGVRAGDRAVLARAITLVESGREDHQRLARRLLEAVLPASGGAIRLGITGVPGAGKSTLIDALGVRLLERGHRVAVLAIDPSSRVSGGSILGDKTRMARLAADERSFIRPSPSATTLGGVGRKTREALLLCEAAGYDIVLVETVGVGQSETVVGEIVDTLLLVLIAGAGDQLQGIKRGVVEMADIVAVNKADGQGLERATRAAAVWREALHYLRPSTPGWEVPVLTCSARTGDGLDELWQAVLDHRRHLERTGRLQERRSRQRRHWLWSLLEERLRDRFLAHPAVASLLPEMERQVAAGEATPTAAAERLLEAFKKT